MKLFRKSGLVLVVLIGGLIAAGYYFISDSLIEEQIEKALSIQNGALVEFDGLSVSLLNGTMSWKKLQITNPNNVMQNSFETTKTSVSITAWKLLQKKVIINNLVLADIRTGTKRAKSGELPKEWIPEEEVEVEDGESSLLKEAGDLSKQAKNALKDKVTNTPVFQLANTSINADSIMGLLKLQSPQKVDSLKKSIEANVKTVTETVEKLNLEKTINESDAKIKSINVNEIKDVKSAEEALKTVTELSKTAKDLQAQLKTAKESISTSIGEVSSGVGQVDNWIKDDYSRAEKIAKLPDFDTQKIGELLLGKELMESITDYLDYAKTGRDFLASMKSKGQVKDENPERGKGQDIRFKSFEPNPDFWVKKVNLTYKTDKEIQLTGVITDIIDNQKLIARPTKADFKGVNKVGETMSVTGEFNYLGEKTLETFQFDMPKMSLRTLDFGVGGSLPKGFTKGNGAVKAVMTITNGAPKADITMRNTDVEFKFAKKASGKSEKVFQDVMSRINSFNIDAMISSNAKGLKVKIDSDIDNQISRQIKAVAKEEVDKIKKQIRAKVDAQVQAKKKELNDEINKQKQKLEAKKKEVEELVNKQLEVIEAKKKEIEKKKDDLIKEAKDKAEQAAKDALKKGADKLKSKLKLGF